MLVVGCSVQHCTTCLIVLHGPLSQPQLTGRSMPLTFTFTFTSIKHFILLYCYTMSPAHLIRPMDTLWTVTTLGVSYSITQFSSLFRASDTLRWKKVLENEFCLLKLCIYLYLNLFQLKKKNYLYLTNCIFQFQDSQGRVTIWLSINQMISRFSRK